MKKILIISRNAWRDDNSTGSTLSNLLNHYNRNEISCLYCRAEKPNNNVCSRYYQMSEKQIINHIFSRKEVGNFFEIKEQDNSSRCEDNKTQSFVDNSDLLNEKKLYDFFRSRRLTILIAARDFLWGIGGWKNKKLNDFLEKENPEVIYMHNFNTIYMHMIYQYTLKRTKAHGILFFTDDNCSFKQVSFSPLYWLYRVIYLKYVKKSVAMSHSLFGITKQMCYEYEKIFNRPIQILYKGGVFDEKLKIPYKMREDGVLRMVYTGNILAGRWETLAYIASAISSINQKEKKYELYIYTADYITDKIRKAICVCDDVHLMPPVSAKEVLVIQKEADILLHVESMRLKERYATRLSFSTKLVDYFISGRCIMAVGWEKAASIDYLKINNAAIVYNNLKSIQDGMKYIAKHPEVVAVYANNSWECGKRAHQIEKIRSNLTSSIEV